MSTPGTAGERRRLVRCLSAMTLLQWFGASAIVPLLPTYLRAGGSSPAEVGLVMASYFALSVLTQYPVGRMSDRVGTRPVIAAGLVIFAAGSVGFALSHGALLAIVFRSMQGVGAGSVTVASAATIAARIPVSERGAAFGRLYGSQMVAVGAGPLVGSILGASSMRALFLVAAGTAVVAIIPTILVLGRAEPLLAPGQPAVGLSRARRGPLWRRAWLGTMLVFLGIGVVSGLYESCWSLLLRLRHAPSYAIGLSWTLYCLPYALLSGAAGRLADRVDRRILATVGTAVAAGFAILYAVLKSVPVLVGLGCLEAVGAVIVSPAALSILAEWTPAAAHGAAQGAVETARNGATAVAAAGSGALFGIATLPPFLATAIVLVLIAAALSLVWRPLPGHVAALGEDGEKVPHWTVPGPMDRVGEVVRIDRERS